MRHDIFPTPVWHIEGAPLKLIDELYQGAYKIKEKYKGRSKSNQGGYQTPTLEWEMFHPEGKEYINNVVSKLLEEEQSPFFKNFKVVSWWYNINGQGHWNIPHTHPDTDVALVFYLTDSDGLLTFLNPHPQRAIHPQSVSINAKRGDVVVFPSELYHYVLPNTREEDRISISMNLQLSIS